jgi:hypothetical protein
MVQTGSQMCFWYPKTFGRWGRPLETPAAGGTGGALDGTADEGI